MKKLKIAKVDQRVVRLVKDIKKNPQIKTFIKNLSKRLQPEKKGWYKGKYTLYFQFFKNSERVVTVNFWFDAGYEDPFNVSVTDDFGYLKSRGLNVGYPISIFKTLDNITADDYADALKQVLGI